MLHCPNAIRDILRGNLTRQQNERRPRSAWRAVDPLYVWSAAVGLFAALVLIAIAQAMRTSGLH